MVSIGEESKEIISDLYSPIDATNRFINLALHCTEEGCQSRQFLLESKDGIRKMSTLLGKLDDYARKIEKELREIPTEKRKGPRTNNRQR